MQNFFAHIRKKLFGSLDQSQVEGINAILAATAGLPLAHRAYALATAYHETGKKMSANRENLNYSVQGLLGTFGRHRISLSEARAYGRSPTQKANQQAIANLIYGRRWGLDNLGNTQPNDGWHFRGGGMDHTTGRANFGKADKELGLGGKLVVNPDLILDNTLAAKVLASGMTTGRYRGVSFSTYLPKVGPATIEQFTKARAILNPDANGRMIAGYAIEFQKALQA